MAAIAEVRGQPTPDSLALQPSRQEMALRRLEDEYQSVIASFQTPTPQFERAEPLHASIQAQKTLVESVTSLRAQLQQAMTENDFTTAADVAAQLRDLPVRVILVVALVL